MVEYECNEACVCACCIPKSTANRADCTCDCNKCRVARSKINKKLGVSRPKKPHTTPVVPAVIDVTYQTKEKCEKEELKSTTSVGGGASKKPYTPFHYPPAAEANTFVFPYSAEKVSASIASSGRPVKQSKMSQEEAKGTLHSPTRHNNLQGLSRSPLLGFS